MFAEHLEALPRVVDGDVLRRGDDDGPGERNGLEHGELGVAGARGQVDHHVVQRAPLDVLEELGEDLVDHRAAPDHGVVLTDEEVHAHELHAVLLGRDDLLLRGGLWALVGPDHPGNVRAVDVGVEQPDARPHLREPRGEVHRDGGLPDPTLPARDRDDVLHARQDVLAPLDARGEVDLDTRVGTDLAHPPRDGGLVRRVGRTERERDVGDLVPNLDVVDEAERDDVVTEIRVLDVREEVLHVGYVHGAGSAGRAIRVGKRPIRGRTTRRVFRGG